MFLNSLARRGVRGEDDASLLPVSRELLACQPVSPPSRLCPDAPQVRTTRQYARDATVIEPAWLPELAPAFFARQHANTGGQAAAQQAAAAAAAGAQRQAQQQKQQQEAAQQRRRQTQPEQQRQVKQQQQRHHYVQNGQARV